MRITVILTLAITTILFSCEKADEANLNQNIQNLIIGSWEDVGYQDSLRIFKRTDNLVKNNYGIEFKLNGKLNENKNAGFCGTTPITYAKFTGFWKSLNESTIEVESAYWGGETTFEVKIISISDDELIAHFIY